MSSKTGRRTGPTQTREAIAAAARSAFAELGYDRATFRAIAAAAGVDPALVVHFFGSKEDLFREVTSLPREVAAGILGLADGPRKTVGRRLATLVVGALEAPATRSIVLARIRCASSHPAAADLVRETVTADLRRLTTALTDDQPALRATLVGSTVVGIALARYVVLVEPLCSLSPDEVVDVLAPTFQRYLVGPLN
jgi:AcrR family transcriptional regulator